jgi:8-oxo-dGTP diphosphatase
MPYTPTLATTGFGKGGEDWFGFLFVVTRFSGAPLERNPEGMLVWVEIEKVTELSLHPIRCSSRAG